MTCFSQRQYLKHYLTTYFSVNIHLMAFHVKEADTIAKFVCFLMRREIIGLQTCHAYAMLDLFSNHFLLLFLRNYKQ